VKVVIKIGSSSLTSDKGTVNIQAIAKLSSEISRLIENGVKVVVVSSAATAVGLKPLGFEISDRPNNPAALRAAAAVGQILITSTYSQCLAANDLEAAQILLAPLDFWNRKRYLRSRELLDFLMEKSIVPIINENDALADSEISFGDNDNLAALVAHLVDADKLILLTDIDGLYTSDPRNDPSAELISVVEDITDNLFDAAGDSGSLVGRGGMASKLSAAQIASRSGVETIICNAETPRVLSVCCGSDASIGTTIRAQSKKVSARKLWIGFALQPKGQLYVDDGAKSALLSDSSLLSAGIIKATGDFVAEDCVDIVDINGESIARGLVKWSRSDLDSYKGKRTEEVPELSDSVVHKDDLVILDS